MSESHSDPISHREERDGGGSYARSDQVFTRPSLFPGSEMTSDLVICAYLDQLRLLLATNLFGDGTAWVEAAAAGWVQWAGYVSFEDGALSLAVRVGDRDGRQQGLSIGVLGIVV